MRLLHVVPSFHPAHLYGGPIVSLHRLARAQVAQGLDVRVLTSDANGGERLGGLAGRWVTEYGVPTWYARAARLPGRTLPRLVPGDLSLQVAACLPALLSWADVVHVTAVFSPTSMLALLQGAAAGSTMVLSPRGSLLPFSLRGKRHKGVALAALRPLLRRVAGWHATSDEEARALRDLGLCGPRAAVSVVENGVDLAELRPVSETASPACSIKGPTITMLGRLHPVKGIDLAIAALAQLRQRHPSAVLVLAGPDPDGYGDVLRHEAERHGVAGAVRFAGLITGPAKAALLAGSDQLWLCSQMESFGNVVIEALAAGTPVVAVQRTPWRWLEEARVGRFVPPTAEDLCAAADGLLQDLADPARRRAFAEHATTAVAERFSWIEIARKMSDLYEAALQA